MPCLQAPPEHEQATDLDKSPFKHVMRSTTHESSFGTPANNDFTFLEPDPSSPSSDTPPGPPPKRAASSGSLPGSASRGRFVYDCPERYRAGEAKASMLTEFEKLKASQEKDQLSEWAPFESEEEWEVAEWLMSSVNQGNADRFIT